MLAILSQSARIAILSSIIEKELFFAWGSGNEEWDADSSLQENFYSATKLVKEVGRRKIQIKYFVTPDPDGIISLPESYDIDGTAILTNYSVSSEPTNYLYLKVVFDYGDAVGETIREVGIFSDTVVDSELPLGQLYFEASQVLESGLLIAGSCESASVRDSARKDSYEFILSL